MAGKREELQNLWFEDGDIIIAAQSRRFRVHKAFMSLHAAVIKDMLSFPQPAEQESTEGVPIVTFPDDERDMEYFVRAVYDKGYFMFASHHRPRWGTAISDREKSEPAPLPYELVESVLRMSHKYDASRIRTQALFHLVTFIAGTAGEVVRPPTKIGEPTREMLPLLKALISLAREVQALWALPQLLYWTSLQPAQLLAETQMWAGRPQQLCSDDLVACLAGYQHILGDPDLVPFRSDPCPANFTHCVWQATGSRALQSPRVPQVAFDKFLGGDPCLGVAYKQWKGKVWDKIPAAYGLPSWDVMKGMICSDLEIPVSDA
ncbi:hypothetical protein BD626DRAFT_520041, partial [Schizophyllum amplum]